MHDDFLAWDNPKVIATLVRLTAVFKEAYPINKLPVAGVAIGRYPEDRYSGDTFDGGNPWPICTLAVAEAWYEYADLLRQRNVSTRDTINMANKFIERVRYHAYKDGSMDEQIDRNTGFMTSARDLTWNYAALLTVRGVAIRATALPLDKTN